MKKILLILSFYILVFTGCSTKKYFEPSKVEGEVEFDGKLPAKIVDITREGATLENGQVITKDGLLDVKLPKDFEYIGEGEGLIVGAHNCGKIVVIDKKNNLVYKKSFEFKRAASAKIKDNLLALVFDNNELMLIDYKKDKILFKQKSETIYSVDTKIASAYFLGDLILFPTLDGKILIVDKNSYKAIRTIIVGTKKFLNNIIYLNVIENRLVAATPNKIISVNPKTINSIDVDLSDVLFVKDAIYILAKDGRVILADIDLNILKTRKYPFAHFTGAIYGEYIYIIEKEGYLIATDHSLVVSNVFELPSKIDSFLFTAKDKIFFDDRYFQLKQ